MSTNNIQGWSERFRNLFSGESALSQAILGALEYRGFYDSGKYLDDTIAERIIPVLEPFIASEIQKAEVEIVICAAIRMPDGYVVRGHRHHDCIRTAREIPRYEDEPWHVNGDDQGFVTSKNRYVTRKEGYKIQISAGIESADYYKSGGYRGDELFSEDLY